MKPFWWAVLGIVCLVAGIPHTAAADDDFLPPEAAFRYTATTDGSTVTVHWTVADGYYLYKSRMSLGASTPGARVGAVQFPRGEVHRDDYFGEQEVFRHGFTVTAPLTAVPPGTRQIALQMKLQGCADAGLCYPPMTRTAQLDLPAAASGGTPSALDSVFGSARSRSNDAEFLPPEQAFRLLAQPDGPDRVRLNWQIADGYYLYRNRLAVKIEGGQAQVGQLVLPTGKTHTDDYFGTQEVYYGDLEATVPVARAAGEALPIELKVTYQGCADAGLCYPPMTTPVDVTLPPGSGDGGFVSEQDRLASLIRTGNLFLVLGTFFGLGLLLAFTPCVLPMVPILSGIIAGHGPNLNTRRAFALSLTYVLGMALTYTVGGMLFAAAGSQAQAVFQQPWIVALFAAMFVALALSMFGLFTVQMPAAVQTRLAALSNRQTAGSFGGVAVMGALSALIVTTCVAPPLVATLAVIGQSGDMVRGGAALFTMSLGMGAPLLVVGASAGKLLPRAGAWMDTVKRFFGVMLLAVAAWMLARIVPDRIALVLWAVPALAAAWLLWTMVRGFAGARWLARLASTGAAAYGILLIAGAAMGATDPLAPLPGLAAKHSELPFRTIKSVADLQREVAQAHEAGRAAMLDFYADWCVSCKEMERYTFSDADVQQALASTVLLRADVTANDDEDQALLRHFGIFGPPTIAFYGADGEERRNFRVVGYMKADEFAKVASQAIARR